MRNKLVIALLTASLTFGHSSLSVFASPVNVDTTTTIENVETVEGESTDGDVKQLVETLNNYIKLKEAETEEKRLKEEERLKAEELALTEEENKELEINNTKIITNAEGEEEAISLTDYTLNRIYYVLTYISAYLLILIFLKIAR